MDVFMNKLLLCVVVVPMLFVLGCDEKKPEDPVKTADWYKEHKEARVAKISECNTNPGELRDTPNCINAQHAQVMVDAAKRELPGGEPMTFPKK